MTRRGVAILGSTGSIGTTALRVLARQGERFRVETARGPVDAEFVVLATGGLSLPKTGSDGAGLEFARALGHTIVPTTPALAPMTLEASSIHAPLSFSTV